MKFYNSLTAYKVLDLVQGTPEWKRARFDYITASNVPVILGISPYKTPVQYYEELVLKSEEVLSSDQEELFAKGHAIEDMARDWLQNELKTYYKPMCLVSVHLPELMASLDGFDPDINIILEVKYCGSKVLQEIEMGKIPEHHRIQIQSQLLVSGAEKCIYFASDGKNSVKQFVTPDLSQFETIASAVKTFATGLREGTPPELTDRDYRVVEDPMFSILRHYKEELEQATRSFESYKKQLVDKYVDSKRVKCDGVSLIQSVRKGNINYKNIPELKGLDLEPFRGKATVVNTVRFDKEKK